MEVASKMKVDAKGGTLIDYEGNIQLHEIAQGPSEHVEDSKHVKKFNISQTNNNCINMKGTSHMVSSPGIITRILNTCDSAQAGHGG